MRHQPVGMASVQGALALELVTRHDPPQPRVGEVISLSLARRAHDRARMERWVHRYAQAAVEIVSGDRPAAQLVRWTSKDVFADLARRAQLVAWAGRHEAGLGRPRHGAVRPRVAGVRVSFPDALVAEAAIRVRYGARFRAVAARFELAEGRWRCTALEFA